MPEASGCLVAPPVFKTGGRRSASSAGSIPVRLRHLRTNAIVARNLSRIRGADGKPSQADIPPDPPPGHLAWGMTARQPAPTVTVTGFAGAAALSGTGTLPPARSRTFHVPPP